MKNLTFDAQISSFSSIIYELLEKNLEILSASLLTDATKKTINIIDMIHFSISEFWLDVFF